MNQIKPYKIEELLQNIRDQVYRIVWFVNYASWFVRLGTSLSDNTFYFVAFCMQVALFRSCSLSATSYRGPSKWDYTPHLVRAAIPTLLIPQSYPPPHQSVLNPVLLQINQAERWNVQSLPYAEIGTSITFIFPIRCIITLRAVNVGSNGLIRCMLEC